MKTIIINISEKTIPSEQVEIITKQIPVSVINTPGFNLIFDQIKECIEDFTTRARKLSQNGTTIRLEKEINYSDFNFKIILNSPEKLDLFNKIKRFFCLNKYATL